MIDQIKNMIIGIFVIAALAIIVFILLFLNPSTGDEGQLIHVRFADIDKINVGTRVTFAGKAIGEVTKIELIEKDRQGFSDEYGHLYVFELTLSIDSKARVYTSDQISARTSGLLGEKSVAIMPVALKPGEEPVLVKPDDILYASESGSVEDTMKEFKEVADKMDTALDNVSAILSDIQNEELVKKMAVTFENIGDLAADFDKPEEISAIYENLQNFTEQLATRLPGTWNMMDEALGGLKNSMGNLQMITQNVKEGKGSAGKILVSDDFYMRFTSLLNKGETLLNDMNHYGLLFQNDKGWQRLRARRMNLLAQLSTPQEFRNFFNDEIDEINSSLSRVTLVLDKIQFCDPCYPYPTLSDKEFTKVFAEFLQRVDNMQEALKLYNQEIVQEAVYQTELEAVVDGQCK